MDTISFDFSNMNTQQLLIVALAIALIIYVLVKVTKMLIKVALWAVIIGGGLYLFQHFAPEKFENTVNKVKSEIEDKVENIKDDLHDKIEDGKDKVKDEVKKEIDKQVDKLTD